MDLNQINYFLHLADCLNFTQAARKSGVSQPSLTKAIRKLEDELGGPLLYRDGRDTRLTALGRDVQVEFMRLESTKCPRTSRKLGQRSAAGPELGGRLDNSTIFNFRLSDICIERTSRD